MPTPEGEKRGSLIGDVPAMQINDVAPTTPAQPSRSAQPSSNTRSVQDAIDNGMPFVIASGIMRATYHDGCVTLSRCDCGVESEFRRLALEFDKALEKFGRRAPVSTGETT